jgi:hypothetical protein
MKAVKIMLALALALVLSLTLVGCNGEGGAGGGEGLSQAEIDQIIASVTTAKYDTVKMAFDMVMDMEVVGGDEEIKMDMVGDGTGVMDMVNQEMQMTMNMSMDIPEIGEQTVASKVYLVGEWMYTGAEMPGLGEQWFKMKVMPGMWEQQNQLEQQVALFEEYAEIEYLGIEAVDGTDCYVFEIVPSMEALGDLLNQQASGMSGVDFSQMDLADLFEEMSVKEWIAVDSYRVLESEVYMRMQLKPEDVGAAGEDFDEMVMDINMSMRMYDYDQPVSIVLPPEAANAMEMS